MKSEVLRFTRTHSDCCVYFLYASSLELIAEKIEDPFGGGDNVLPTKKMIENTWGNCVDFAA